MCRFFITILLTAFLSGQSAASSSHPSPELTGQEASQQLSPVEGSHSILEWHSEIITACDTATGEYYFDYTFDYTFDFSEIPEIVSGDFNNLYVRYWSADCNDRDVWIYNFSEEKWDTLGVNPCGKPGCGGCAMTAHFGRWLAEYCLPDKYAFFDSGFRAIIRAERLAFSIDITAFRFKEKVRLSRCYPNTGMACDGDWLWGFYTPMCTDDENLLRFRPGQKAETICKYGNRYPGRCPVDVAWDGEFFYVSDFSGMIFRLHRWGMVRGSFEAGTANPRGLTYDGRYLWLVESQPPYQFFQIDIERAMADGSARNAVVNSFPSPVPGPTSLEWVGDGFVLGTGSRAVYRVSADGGDVDSVYSGLDSTYHVAFDGEHIWAAGYILLPYIDSYASGKPCYAGLRTLAIVDVGELLPGIDQVYDLPEWNIPFAVYPPYPNPFNQTIKLKIDIPQEDVFRVGIYDMMGHRINQLLDKKRISGDVEVTWDGTDLDGSRVSSGVYFFVVQGPGKFYSRKVVFIK